MKGRVASPLGAMDSLTVLAGLSGVAPRLAEGLQELGWNVNRLGTLRDADRDMVETVATMLEEHLKEPVNLGGLRKLIEVAGTAAEVKWKAEGRGPDSELMAAHMAAKLEDQINQQRKLAEQRNLTLVPRMGKAKLDRWPTRLSKKLEMAGDNTALRESLERNERARWITALKRILVEADSPATTRSQMVTGVDMVRRFGKGRRSSTLRKHVKTWEKVRGWLMATFNKPWPVHSDEFALYLEARANEPCGKTVPSSIFKTLLFLESAGEWPQEEQISRKAGVKNVLEEINMQLAGQQPAFVRRAWRMPVQLVISLEEMVSNEKKSSYQRIYCWFRLVKLWTGMRFSDTCGLDNRSLEIGSRGLTGILCKTKTTGPGKKVQLLRIWVGVDCWIRNEMWLDDGFKLWTVMSQEAGLVERDYMLPCPTADMSGFINRMVTYSLASRFSQGTFRNLWTEFEGARVPLLDDGVGTVWTEHSERATMRTWSEASGIPEEVRKQM